MERDCSSLCSKLVIQRLVCCKRIIKEVSGAKVNDITLIPFLSACVSVGVLVQGKEVHGHSVKYYPPNGSQPENDMLNNALINMYVKCKHMEPAEILFASTGSSISSLDRNMVTWTVMICATYLCAVISPSSPSLLLYLLQCTRPTCVYSRYFSYMLTIFIFIFFTVAQYHTYSLGVSFTNVIFCIHSPSCYRHPRHHLHHLWQHLAPIFTKTHNTPTSPLASHSFFFIQHLHYLPVTTLLHLHHTQWPCCCPISIHLYTVVSYCSNLLHMSLCPPTNHNNTHHSHII
jgi:hypothetical protein